MIMHRRHFLAALLALPWLAASALAEKPATPLRVVLASDVYTDYQHFIGKRDPLTLKTFSGPGSRRDVVEVILLQQALRRGGENRPLQFVLTDSESRTVKALANGEADISGASSWKANADSNPAHISASLPVIRDGDFVAGLYFPADAPALKTLASDPAGISRYVAVCAEHWDPDITALQALGSKVLHTDNWESMLGMLRKKRADFVLAPFQPTPGLQLKAGGMVLKPVPGVKVSLAGSRHFLLSRSVQGAPELQKQLNAGLQQLQKEGVLARAYQESGFENASVRNWKLLNTRRSAP